MASMAYEQENDMLDQLSDNQMLKSTHKMLTTEMSRKTLKELKTPSLKASLKTSLKTSVDKSSRKAFGNVSNVLRSESKPSLAAKTLTKGQSDMKGSEAVNSALNDHKKSMATQEASDCTVDPKLLDDVEDMYPMSEELISDLNDPISVDLFAIDERTVFAMPFDSDVCQPLLQKNPKNFDFNQFF